VLIKFLNSKSDINDVLSFLSRRKKPSLFSVSGFGLEIDFKFNHLETTNEIIIEQDLMFKTKKINKTEIFILLTISMIFTIMYTLPEYLEIYFHYIASPFVKCPK